MSIFDFQMGKFREIFHSKIGTAAGSREANRK